MGSDTETPETERSLVRVSIHAPTRGATFAECLRLDGGFVSIHAPTWGATRIRITRPRRRFNPRSHMGATNRRGSSLVVSSFQSTLPHGERQYTLICCSRERIVSIHAPTWERPAIAATYAHQERFNPRSRMGSDTNKENVEEDTRGFQSTLPHGERRIIEYVFKILDSFNPRSRMGSDDQLEPFPQEIH